WRDGGVGGTLAGGSRAGGLESARRRRPALRADRPLVARPRRHAAHHDDVAVGDDGNLRGDPGGSGRLPGQAGHPEADPGKTRRAAVLRAVGRRRLEDTVMRVLVVDDSRTMRRIICSALEELREESLEVLEAADGMEALQLLRNEKLEIDLVLIDWN